MSSATFAERMTRPQTSADYLVQRAYRASIEAAGRDWQRELRVLKLNEKPLPHGGYKTPPVRRTSSSKSQVLKSEFDNLSHHQRMRLGGFANFVARRRAGLIAADGSLTGR